MAKAKPKCGICGCVIGTGCGCCAWDFPEDYGYCARCYPKSQSYLDKMQVLKSMLDRMDSQSKELLHTFVQEYLESHEHLYLEEIEAAQKQQEAAS